MAKLIFNPSVQRYVEASLTCDFCSITNQDLIKPKKEVSELPIWKDHYEQHLNPPRKVNICPKCHVRLHRVGRKKKSVKSGPERQSEITSMREQCSLYSVIGDNKFKR